MNWLLYVIVIGYMAFIFYKGISKARRIGSSDDFLIAGRNVGWLLLFTTLGATVIGGGYSIGAVAETYSMGLVWAIVSTGGYLHFIFSGLVVAPQFRKAQLYTVAGYFGWRFGERPRFLALILSVLFSVFIIAAQMAAFGSVLSTLLPTLGASAAVLTWAIIIGGVIVIVYSTAGGLLAVIYTDVYQFVILFIGFIVTCALAIPTLVAKWDTIATVLPDTFFMWDGGKGWLFVVTTFLAFLLGETFGPAYATRYCIAKDVSHTKKGIAGVGFVLAFTFPVFILITALYGRLAFQEVEGQQALAEVVKHLNHPVFAGLMIAALLSAVMSSADSALNSATTIFTKDLFEHQLKWRDRSDKYILRLARILTVVLGVASTLIAVLFPDIIGLLLFTYQIWAPAIILPICIGALSGERSPAQNANIFWTMLSCHRDYTDLCVYPEYISAGVSRPIRAGCVWSMRQRSRVLPYLARTAIRRRTNGEPGLNANERWMAGNH